MHNDLLRLYAKTGIHHSDCGRISVRFHWELWGGWC
ncbi:MAG: hypothetical protein ACI9UA_004835 [Pseudoalteromonas tetraodonis]|jgi:hypothetical protein